MRRTLRLVRAVAVVFVVLVAGAALLVVSALPLAPGPASAEVPPILAGQHLWGYCSAGFYARLGDTIVVTSTGHCTSEGATATYPDGTIIGVFGPPARDATCPYEGHVCAAADINYLVLAKDQIPWGRLNRVYMGSAGYRTIEPGTQPLGCDDVRDGDAVEIDGRNIHRSGSVLAKDAYVHDGDGTAFPCMILANVIVSAGDSGGGVLIRGIPAGVTSREFGSVLGFGLLGFTPLADGLKELGLQLCTTPNCDLIPPTP